MKKVFLFILVLLGAVIAFSACNKRDTYADKLKKERRAISRFIDTDNIEVLTTFPEDSVFAKNEYFKDANTGVYFRVDDFGKKGATVELGTEVFIRIGPGSILLVDNDTVSPYFNNSSTTTTWVGFTYGLEISYTQGNKDSNADLTQFYLSPACVLPLKYNVRNGGVVSLIVPFSSGSLSQQAEYKPLYIKEIRYTYYND